MKTTLSKIHSTWRPMMAGSIIGLFVLLVTACASTSTPTAVPMTALAVSTATSTAVPATPITVPTSTPTLTEVPPSPTTTAIPPSPMLTATIASPTAGSADIAAIAEIISKDMGKVLSTAQNEPSQKVFVFEETHVSPAGQIEIAVMLNRLYENYGLRTIGLEGAFAKDGTLKVPPASPPFFAKHPIGAREDTIAHLLESGEISSAELMDLTYNDMHVAGIEDASQYVVDIPDQAQNADLVYLYKIAASEASDSALSSCVDLINQNKTAEAIICVINADSYTKATYAQLNDPTIVNSSEDLVQLLDAIQAKATQTQADITADDKSNLAALRKFYQTASERTQTIVDNTLMLVKQSAGAPVAMTIGAAHTERAVQLLKAAGVSFAVIEPNSLANNQTAGDLSSDAYARKLKQQSVGEAGSLGALLDGRKKPQPVVEKQWFKSDFEISWLGTLLARAALDPNASLDEALVNIQSQLQSVKVIPGSVSRVESSGGGGTDGVIFGVTALDDHSEPVNIYVHAKADKQAVSKLLEQRLIEGLGKVRAKSLNPRAISSDTIAVFGKTPDAVRSVNLGD